MDQETCNHQVKMSSKSRQVNNLSPVIGPWTDRVSLAEAATSIIFVLLRQTHVCRNKTQLLSQQKYACHDKTFVATNIFLLRQNFCCNKLTFVTTKVLFWQSTSFVMTKMILVAAPASDKSEDQEMWKVAQHENFTGRQEGRKWGGLQRRGVLFQINTGTKVYSKIQCSTIQPLLSPWGNSCTSTSLLKNKQALAPVYTCIIGCLLSDVHTDTHILEYTHTLSPSHTHTHTDTYKHIHTRTLSLSH